MKAILLAIVAINLLAAGLVIVVSITAGGIGALNSVSEMEELVRADAIDPAKLSRYDPRRFPTTAAAAEALREPIPQLLVGPAIQGLRTTGLIGAMVAVLNATVASVFYMSALRAERHRRRAL